MKTARNTFAIAAMGLATAFATQANALPIFTFTEHAGFTADVGMAKYSDRLSGDAGLLPAASPLYRTMSWVGDRATRSSLALATVTNPTGLIADTWTTISTLYHDNKLIQGLNSWSGQDIHGRFIISDADGGVNRVLDSDSVITLNMTETKNTRTCPKPNPVGTTCDDYFTITTPINDLFFSANDGSQWMATFRFANLVNAVQLANVVYTGEGMTGSVDVQVLVTGLANTTSLRTSSISAISAVPEPATLIMLCLGLFGLGIARQRMAKAPAAIPVKPVRR